MVIVDSPSMLVERETPLIIKSLQNKGIKILGYTGSKLGSLGKLSSFPDWRYNELNRLDIDFIKIFPGKVVFKEFKDLGGDPIGIEKGIVYSGYKHTKGSVLKSVLSHYKGIEFIPKANTNIKNFEEKLAYLIKETQIICPEDS